MNYSELTTALEETTENTFTVDQLARITKLAEQFIYNTVQLPALRRNKVGTLTATSPYIKVPADYLYPHSFAVADNATGLYEYLVPADVNFIREAYPNQTVTAKPKYYSQFDGETLFLGPTPDIAYPVELHYGYYPESIVTATNTWLGDNFDSALFNAMLVEAARFMKADDETMTMYKEMRDQSILLLKQLGDGKLRQDSNRSGQVRMPVN